MTSIGQSTSFTLYRCTNSETSCDYPFLAVADDGSVLLTIGDYTACFERDLPDELNDWLAHDFTATGAAFTCDLSTVRHMVHAAFADHADFLLMRFDEEFQPNGVEFSLATQKTAEEGPEYLVEDRSSYYRLNRFPRSTRAVTPTEQALLDVCVAMVRELAAEQHAAL